MERTTISGLGCRLHTFDLTSFSEEECAITVRIHTHTFNLEISVLNQFLHDATFAREDVSYDPGMHTLVIKVAREAFEQEQHVRKVSFLSKVRVPIVEATVKCNNVVEAIQNIVDVEDMIEEVTFQESTSTLTIRCVRGSMITVVMNPFEIEVLEGGGRDKYTSLWIWN